MFAGLDAKHIISREENHSLSTDNGNSQKLLVDAGVEIQNLEHLLGGKLLGQVSTNQR